MFFIVKAKKALIVVLIIILAAAVAAVLFCGGGKTRRTSAPDSYTLVVDPGHGGIDGGAVAADGTKESGINLAIAQKMAALADLYGKKCVLTRSSEESGVSAAEYSERQSLLDRAAAANSIPGAVLISVHQNNYPTPQPSGAQIMYAKTEGSLELGESAQNNLVTFADRENRRVASPAPDELLLTRSVRCPAILAECGFMSNPAEAGKLSTGEYQLKIACALTAAYMTFTENVKTM